jgi:hypothetical protein
MARPSMRARLLCAAGAIVLMTAIPVAHPVSAQGLNDIVRNLNNTMNPNAAQLRENQARRPGGRSEEGQYRHGNRPTSESREYNRDGGDRGDYGDRRDNGERR